jgi:hypothetical protein
LCACAAQYPLADFLDQAAILDHWNKYCRRDDFAALLAAAEAAVFVAMRAAALARAGLRVSPASFLRASLVRMRVEAVEADADASPPCFAGLPASAVAAAIELGRFRYRWCRAQQQQQQQQHHGAGGALTRAPDTPRAPKASALITS